MKFYNLDEAIKNRDKMYYFKRKKVNKMFEVTYSMNGIIKKFNVVADDPVQAQALFTNMFGGGAIEIINIVRK